MGTEISIVLFLLALYLLGLTLQEAARAWHDAEHRRRIEDFLDDWEDEQRGSD